MDLIRTLLSALAIAISFATAGYTFFVKERRDRVRTTIDFWGVTNAARFEARQLLPYEFDGESIELFVQDVMQIDADLRAAGMTPDTIRFHAEFANDASDDQRDLYRRLERRTQLYRYLSFVETLGTGVDKNVFDFDTVLVLDGPRLEQTWAAYGGLISEWRGLNSYEAMYAGVESLARRLSQRR